MRFDILWKDQWHMKMHLLNGPCPKTSLHQEVSFNYNNVWWISFGWEAHYTNHFWHHTLTSPALIVWILMGQHIFLNIIPTHVMVVALGSLCEVALAISKQSSLIKERDDANLKLAWMWDISSLTKAANSNVNMKRVYGAWMRNEDYLLPFLAH